MQTAQINILIADDDPDALDLLTHQLKGDDFCLKLCDSAEAALNELEKMPDKYDVVLLDQNMPGGLSGIECLEKIKAGSQFRQIPVILQTCENEPETITKALRAGAHYFLEKTTDRSIIQAVIYSAVESKVRFQEVENERHALKCGLCFVEEARFRIRTLDEMNVMTAILCTAYPDPDRVTLGIHELLTNAIEHGNLDITYEGKSELILKNKWKQEVDRRLSLPEHKNKTVEIEIKKTPEQIELTVTDQGTGFNCDNYLEIDPCRLFDPHGRGIAVARSLSFDELEYIGCGNKVRTVVKLNEPWHCCTT